MQEGVPQQRQASAIESSPSKGKANQRPAQHDRIVLCIGGRILQTSMQTLCVDSDSMLSAWVLRHLHSRRDADEGPSSSKEGAVTEDADAVDEDRTDKPGHVLWIDRDARRFEHVLNYLRNGTIWLEDIASLRAVQEEAVFFGLAGLETLCEERIQAVESLEKKKSVEMQHAIQDAIADLCKSHLPCFSPLGSSSSSKGEVLAILRARRLGAAHASEPTFQMDEDF